MFNIEKAIETKGVVENILSERELEILRLMAIGSSRSDISKELTISVLTYDEHRKNIRNKLGLNSYADWAKVLVPFMN